MFSPCSQASAKAVDRAAAEVNSVQEARKLAFYLFWNIKEDFDRCVRLIVCVCWCMCVCVDVLWVGLGVCACRCVLVCCGQG